MSSWGDIRTRTFLLFMVPLLVLMSLGVWLGYQRVVSTTLDAATNQAAAAAEATATSFSSHLGRVAQTATATALHVSLTELDGPGSLAAGQDEDYYQLLEANVQSDPLIYGSAFGFAPDRLADRERFAPYVHRSGETLRRIDIGAKSYDYTLSEWEWYAGPAADRGPRWTAPYFDTDAGGIMMVTYTAPISDDRDFGGVATVDVPMSALSGELNIPVSVDTRLFVLESDGTVVWDSAVPDTADRVALSDLSPDGVDMDWVVQVLGPVSGSVDLPPSALGGSRAQKALHAPIRDTPWTLLAVLDEASILHEVRIESAVWGLGGLLAFLLVGLIAWRAAGDASRRMEGLAQQAASLSAGDYSTRAASRTDELGAVATALNDLADELAVRETALEDAEQKRFAALVNASPMGTLVLSADGRIDFANAAALEFLSPGLQDLVGRPMESLLSARALRDFPEGLPQATAGTRMDLGRLELLGPDDAPIMVEANLAGVAGTDGDILTMVSVRDLRDELRAARTLAERERFLAGIFQNAGVGIVVTDPDGTIRDANVTFREYVGQELGELLGTTFRDLLHPDERDEGGRILAALGRGALNGFVTEHRYLRDGGALSWGETRSAALRDANDEVERIIVAVTDLTARRRANATFRAVFQHSDDAYLILRRTHVEDANGSALELFGVNSVGDLSMPLLGPAHSPEFLPSGLPAGQLGSEILARAWGGTTFRGEWAVRRRDGSEAPIGVALVPVEIGDDDALLVVAHDLTQRKQFESELVVARDEAESAARAKSDFLATMSHEIRTPMNGVIGMVDLLAQSSLSPDQQRMITTTRDSAFALLAIINDVLDFSKIEAGKLELEQVPISLHDLVDAVCEMLGKNAGDAGLQLQGLVTNDVPDLVLGDPVRLRQILFNLVGNAIKFTRHGRVEIRASRVASPEGDLFELRVDDTGIGMTPEQVGNLFQPFTQAESSTTRQFGGTGLGLSIVLRLVRLMDGEVTVESRPDEGSSFVIRLPMAAAPEAAEEESSATSDLEDTRIVVCAEGSPEREAVMTYLRRGGALVDEVPVSELVARLIAGPMPDVVYLGSGVDAVERVRLRGQVDSRPPLMAIAFVAGMPEGSSLAAPDLPDTTLVPAAPLTRGGLLHAVAVALGRIDPVAVSTDRGPATPVTREEAIAAGQLLLVAEDNRTNQEVIRRQLALLGYHADVVEDGIEALEAMEGTDYAALLTDCHMPRLDGFALTHRVREESSGRGRRMPIVAITANALQGEGERCLAEGMDDYLTKPLELDRLQASLMRWVGPPSVAGMRLTASGTLASAATVPSVPPVGEPSAPAADENSLAILDSSVLERMLRGDRATARVLMAGFVPTAKDLVDVAVVGLEAGDGSELIRAGHTLKSSSRAVGALRLGDTCEELEQAARDGAGAPGVADIVARLQDDFHAVAQAIADELATSEARP